MEGETSTTHCSGSSPPLTLFDIANVQQNPPLRRSSTRKYSNVILEYFDISPRRRRRTTTTTSSPSQTVVRETPELSAHLERANRALQSLKKNDVHIAYSSTCKLLDGDGADAEQGTVTEGPKHINFIARHTVPTRSDLTIEGLDSSTKLSRKDNFIERQIKVR